MPPAPTSDSGPTTARVPSNIDGPADTAPVLVPVKVTEKMLEREQYQRELREEEHEEEDGGYLMVIDGEEEEDERSPDNSPSQASAATKGKSKAPSEKSMGKRKRQPIDPFAGLCTFIQSLLSNLTVTFPPARLRRLWRGSPFRTGR